MAKTTAKSARPAASKKAKPAKKTGAKPAKKVVSKTAKALPKKPASKPPKKAPSKPAASPKAASKAPTNDKGAPKPPASAKVAAPRPVAPAPKKKKREQLTPLPRSSGPGAAARNAIGVVLVGGMAIGTLFTLFVVPAVYVLIAKDRAGSGAEGDHEPAAEPSPAMAQ